MNEPIFDFQTFLDCVKAALTAKFPTFEVLEFGVKKEMTKMTLFIDVEQFDCTDDFDIGTGQVKATMQLHIYVVRSMSEKNKIRVRKNALDVLQFGMNNRWGYNAAGRAVPMGAFPDRFKQDADECNCMRVEFEHTILLGTPATLESYEGTATPEEVSVSENGGEQRPLTD